MPRVNAPPATVEVVKFDDFAVMFKRHHRQGEHASIVGPTGSGKSVLELSLCKVIATRRGQDRLPARVVVLGTKPRDDTLSALGWPVVKKWPPSYGQEHCIVWPRGGNAETRKTVQRNVFRPLLNTIYHEGGQTVAIDEAATFEDPYPESGLGLGGIMKEYWTTARSLKLTLIAATQRPRNVTRSMWSEPSWVFVFEPEDEDDLRRVSELSGAREQVLDIVPQLGGHEFLCIRRQRDSGVKRLYISKVGT